MTSARQLANLAERVPGDEPVVVHLGTVALHVERAAIMGKHLHLHLNVGAFFNAITAALRDGPPGDSWLPPPAKPLNEP